MLAVLNSLNAHNFLIFQPILIIFVSKIVSECDQEILQSQTADNPLAPRGRAKFMVHRALPDKAYL